MPGGYTSRGSHGALDGLADLAVSVIHSPVELATEDSVPTLPVDGVDVRLERDLSVVGDCEGVGRGLLPIEVPRIVVANGPPVHIQRPSVARRRTVSHEGFNHHEQRRSHVALTGHRRVLVVLLAAASVVGLAGTAAASLPGSGARARPDAVTPALTTPVNIVARKFLKQNSTGVTTGALFTVSGLSFRSVCTLLTAGVFRIEIQAKSSGGGFLVGGVGSGGVLNGTFQTIWTISGATQAGNDETFDIIFPNGTSKRFDAAFSVHALGADCATLLVAYSG